jgi:hydrogenase maturation protein HypF
VLLGDAAGFTRIGRCGLLPMPGGEKAIREPWRMVVGFIATCYSQLSTRDIAVLLPGISESDIANVGNLVRFQPGLKTSSIGRLFDLAAVLLMNRLTISYEGQGAQELQDLAESATDHAHGSEILSAPAIVSQGQLQEVSPIAFLGPILEGIRLSADPAVLAMRFHRAIATWVLHMSLQSRQETGINIVALTGGVFQNSLLLKLSRQYLEAEQFKVLFHRRVPCNDGGIAFGQLAVALSLAGVDLFNLESGSYSGFKE